MKKAAVVLALAVAVAAAAGWLALTSQVPAAETQFGYGGKGPQAGKDKSQRAGQWALTEEEIAAVLYMREEEKLARDLYLTLYNATGEKIFYNLAQSEQRHMDAVLSIIQKYGLPDPAEGKAVGEFENPEIAKLYGELLARASGGLLDALMAAAYVEEHDIVDINHALTYVQNPDVKRVFQNLLEASKNHLRTLVGEIESRFGVSYKPQLLGEEEFRQILEGGGRGRRGGG